MNTSKCPRVCEREVKETVRIDLVKAPRQAQFILARSGFITTLDKQQTGNSRHEDLLAILPTSPTAAGSGKPLQAVTREAVHNISPSRQ
jgi:hypothetical protein